MRNPKSPRTNGARESGDGFARALAREEFGRFYWNDALASAVARQQAEAARRIEEARAEWKARARARAKAARKELRRRIGLAQRSKSRCADDQSGE